jgi:hypothetical protein
MWPKMPKATLASVWVSEVAISGRANDKAEKKTEVEQPPKLSLKSL